MNFKVTFLVLILFFSFDAFSQRPGGGKVSGKGMKQEKIGEIYGSIVDSLTDEQVPYVTIQVIDEATESLITTSISEMNGGFSIQKLPFGTFTLKFSFFGYNTLIQKGIVLSPSNTTYQLKNVKLPPETLGTLEVIGGDPEVVFEIDKKVIKVEDQINTDGQSATEILENIPSITVSADGTVSLRGSSNFTLLIDGIPTAMDASDVLATIPASSIKDIEIITNPSARFDAEGTNGVINIITKKSKLEGVSCLVNGTVSRFQNYNSDIALSVKKNKFEFTLNGNIGTRGRPSQVFNERTTTYDDYDTRLTNEGESNWRRNFKGIGAGLIWTPNNSHVFSLKTNFKSTLMDPYSDYLYLSYIDDSLESSFFTDQHRNIDIFGNTSNLYYQYNFKRDKKHFISFKAISNIRIVNQLDTTTTVQYGELSSSQLYTEEGPSNSFRFNVDYTRPFKNKSKLEVGAQTQFGRSGDIGKNYSYNLSTEEYDLNELLSSDVNYVRDVHAGYLMYGGMSKKLGYQIGLRGEYTYRTISSSKDVDFTTINRLDLFPSAHFSYSLKEKAQINFSYSRRIKRPRSHYFEPFVTWTSPYSVRSGNPNLNPEYINAFEINYMKPLKKKGFVSLETFYRKNTGTIEWVSQIYDDEILIESPFNIGSSSSLGGEATISYNVKEWWKAMVGGSAYYFDINGSLDDIDYSSNSINSGVSLTNTFTVKGWMIQLMSRLKSGSASAQGYSKGNFTQDLSIKKSIWNKRLSFTLQSRNLLATARRESYSTTRNIEIHNLSEPLAPQVSLTISLKLNNYQKVMDREDQLDDF